MSKTSRRGDEKQISMLLPIEGKPAAKKSSSTVVYRSKEFYELRKKLVKSLPSKKTAS